MRKAGLVVVAMVLSCVRAVPLLAEEAAPAKISIRKVEGQTLLYSVYRGPYEKIGEPIARLYALAGQKQLAPRGPLALVYLNNPTLTSPAHCLTEIRIPVAEDAKKLAGTLGPMTDVKVAGPREFAVIEKSPGAADYVTIFRELDSWIVKNGYCAEDDAAEVFAGAGGKSFDQMKSEIMVPVSKIKP